MFYNLIPINLTLALRGYGGGGGEGRLDHPGVKPFITNLSPTKKNLRRRMTPEKKRWNHVQYSTNSAYTLHKECDLHADYSADTLYYFSLLLALF